MESWSERVRREEREITEAIAAFPSRFGLRGWSGSFFISAEASYYSGGPVLYVYCDDGAFCKGTPDEIRAAMVPL